MLMAVKITFLRQNVPNGIAIEEIIIENGVLKISARSKYTTLFGEMLENFASSGKTIDIILLGAKFGSESEDFTFDIEIKMKNI